MSRWDWIDLCIDLALILLLAAVATIAAVIALPVVASRRVADEIALRWHARRLARTAQSWANHPADRRKETP